MFVNKNLKTHFFIAVAVAIFLRILSIHYVWGPQALDDYLDNLIPAWKHMSGINPDLHDYRSPFYMWILSAWLRFGSTLGIQDAILQIQWVYILQASFSILAIYAAYLYFSGSSESEKSGKFSMYLIAAHGLMPFATTRSFMESIVIGPVTLGLVLLALSSTPQSQTSTTHGQGKSTDWKTIIGYTLLGLSTLLRFQIGIIYVAFVLLALFKKNKRQFLIGTLIGFFLIGAEAIIDIGFGRYPFQTLHDYFSFNSDQQKSGIMPWYNTVLTVAGMIYFPFSLALGKGWWNAIKKNGLIFFPIFIYFLVHTINPHKEERYLYPILGILLILWGVAWAENSNKKLIKYFWWPFFIIFNSFLLFVGCFINTQVGLVGPLAEVQRTTKNALVLDFDLINMRPQMASFFIREPSIYKHMENQLDHKTALSEFENSPQIQWLVLISTHSQSKGLFKETYKILSETLGCSDIIESTSLSDKILYQLRPDRNERRQPAQYFYCERKDK